MTVILHGYWRSLATFRVRIALNLKGVDYEEKIVAMRLASHVAGARLFQCNLSGAPRLTAIVDGRMKLDAFARAHPWAQPGAPAAPA